MECPAGRRGNAAALLLALIRLYQIVASPWLRCCRFEPSCSRYAAQAIAAHGAFDGVLLAVLRLLRCHPLCKGGYDPVPDTPPSTRWSLRNKKTKR